MESRNNVYYNSEYTKTTGCPGECRKKHQEKHDKHGDLEERGKYYTLPQREFNVREDGMWTTVTCKTCGHSHFWAIGDGDDWW